MGHAHFRERDQTRPMPDAPRDSKDRGRSLGSGVRVVYEDDAILVVDKPAGLPVMHPPGRRRDDGMTVFDVVRRAYRRGPGSRMRFVNQLDPEASGLLVLGRTDEAFADLREQLRTSRPTRIATAVLVGSPPLASDGPESWGTVLRAIVEDQRGRVRALGEGESRPVQARRGRVAEATTHYRVVRSAGGRSLVQLRLETDRRGQARAHMRALGCPIVGDDQPAGPRTGRVGRIMLHLGELGVVHPVTRQKMRWKTPPPPAFDAAVPAEPTAVDGPAGGPASGPAGASAVAAGAGTPQRSQPGASPATSWEPVAGWYDALVGQQRSDHHERVVIPGVVRLLGDAASGSVLDIGCGQGVLAHELATHGGRVVGVDASESLIEAARARQTPACRFVVGDARTLDSLDLSLPGEPDGVSNAEQDGTSPAFDAAAAVLSLMNIDPLAPVLAGCASVLKAGAPLVMVVIHPAFRAPKQTSWGWAIDRQGRETQYRRVDAYLSTQRMPITMNPGAVARGDKPVLTHTFHRPLSVYAQQLRDAGFVIDAIEEWASQRTSEPGLRANEENRARREIPLFLAIRALRRAD